MDSFDAYLGAITKVEWIADRLPTLATIQPRHIGRIVSFDHFESATDPANYGSIHVLGELEGIAGNELCVSGVWYEYEKVSSLKSYRKEIKK